MEERFKVKPQFLRPVNKQEFDVIDIIKKADEEKS